MDQGYATAAVPSAPKQQQVSDINTATIDILQKTVYNVEGLLHKVQGPRPTGEGKAGNEPVRCVMNDAITMRRLANEIAEGVQRLHEVIGHDK